MSKKRNNDVSVEIVGLTPELEKMASADYETGFASKNSLQNTK